MKKLFISVLAIFTFVSTTAFSQFTFSVNPGMELNGANVGYKFGNLIPYAGIQVMSGSISMEDSYKDFEGDPAKLVSITDEETLSGTIIMPYVGMKYLLSRHNDIRPYLNGTIFLPILMGSEERDGETNKDFEDAIDGFSVWGLEFGFGTEYNFSKNFSVSGEFGIRMLFAGESTEYDNYYYDPETYEEYVDEGKREVDLNLNLTYARVGLNFYFGD